MTLDLASLDTASACDAGAEIELRHPVTDETLGIFITLKGKDSAAFRSHVRQSINARVKRRGNLTTEENEADGISLLVACTISWRDATGNQIEYKGERLDCTPDNATKIYKSLPWIRRQVDEGIADLGNFLTV